MSCVRPMSTKKHVTNESLNNAQFYSDKWEANLDTLTGHYIR